MKRYESHFIIIFPNEKRQRGKVEGDNAIEANTKFEVMEIIDKKVKKKFPHAQIEEFEFIREVGVDPVVDNILNMMGWSK